MLLECEDPAEFQRLVDEYTSFYQPANPVERHFVEEIIGADWRIRRLKIIEVALVDHQMATNQEEIEKTLTGFDSGIHLGLSFKGLSDDSRSVSLLSRYESRLHRIYNRSHQAFMDLRRDIAAGLIGMPPAPVPPEPPAPEPLPPPPVPVTETKPSRTPSSDAKKMLKNEPAITRVLRRIHGHRPLNAAFRRSKKAPARVPQAIRNA